MLCPFSAFLCIFNRVELHMSDTSFFRASRYVYEANQSVITANVKKR